MQNESVAGGCDGQDGRPLGCRWQSRSDDGGLTWTDLKPMPSLPDPTNKGGVARWDDGQALLFVGARAEIEDGSRRCCRIMPCLSSQVNTAVDGTAGGRFNVTLRASRDDGAAWDDGLLVSEPGGYSDVVVTEWDAPVAAVIYENATCEISLALVDPAAAFGTKRAPLDDGAATRQRSRGVSVDPPSERPRGTPRRGRDPPSTATLVGNCSAPDPVHCPQFDNLDECLACARCAWCDVVDEPPFCTTVKWALELPKEPPHECSYRQ